jgi:hypothetical protein
MIRNHKLDWYYEGNISRVLADNFIRKGFTVIKNNSENIKKRGEDLIFQDATSFIVMEVKGYPTLFHTKGKDKGTLKITKPHHQAKHWFNEVLMSSLYNYRKNKVNSNLKLDIGLPKMEVYEKLLKEVEDYFADNNLELQVYLVDENKNVFQYFFNN